MNASNITTFGVPAVIIAVVIMMVVPIPTQLLDFLLVVQFALAVVILVMALRVKKPLDFSTFPAVILVATVFRVALNISSTRLVLLNGYAGRVIEAFGEFVVGGSIVVGLVIFAIIMVVQFLVITNGAGRVAEVSARFTLDAMPGKQMAIDADLNSGLIDEDQARERRKEITAEADFYGSMDGASKFVKGDAISTVIITLINLIGGFTIGMVQRGMDFSTALSTYSLMTVGDGLVSQIPALLISVSTGIIVTRANTDNDMGTDLFEQFSAQKQTIQIGGGAILLMGLVPSMPLLPFAIVGGSLLFLSTRIGTAPEEPEEPDPDELEPTTPQKDSPMAIAQDMRVEPLELELAYDLIDLVDAANGGDLLDRVRALRRKLAQEIGIVVPLVRTRDNLDLPPRNYAIRVHGVEVARGQAPAGMVLAIGDDLDELPGTPTQEPVFGLAAKWVPAELREHMALATATVVDRSSVVTTHMAEVVRVHAADLLGREDVKMLVDMVRQSNPVVIEELTPQPLSLGEVQRTLQSLLNERVCIRDLVRIFEAMSMRGKVSTDPDGLTEAARAALGPAIAASHAIDGRLCVVTFDSLLEQKLLENLRVTEAGATLMVDPMIAETVANNIMDTMSRAEASGDPPVFVCAQPLRLPIRRLLEQVAPRIPVLSYSELGGQLTLVTSGVVNVGEIAA